MPERFQTGGRFIVAAGDGKWVIRGMDQDPNTMVQPQDRTIEVLCHLLGLALWTGIPFANVLAPLFLWLWKRDGNPSVDEHGKEAINFQLSIAIYSFLSALLIFVLVGIVLLPIVLILHLVLTIVAGLEASKGVVYRYPLTIRFLK